MSQYSEYQIALTNGDATVTGVGATKFLANTAIGDLLFVGGATYEVGSVTDDTHLELTSLYAGATTAGIDYVIHRGFSPIYGIPYPDPGDADAPQIFRRAVMRIEELLNLAEIAEDAEDVWITPAYSAGNFVGSGAMTWTVQSGDVLTYQYHLQGKKMTINWYLNATSIAGTPSNSVKIAIPAGKVVVSAAAVPCYISDNGAYTVGEAAVGAGYVNISRIDNAAFTASANASVFAGQITFEVL